MKNRASVFLKQILSAITCLVKSRSMAIRRKTSAIKTRIIIYSLLNNKKVVMSSISHKFNSLLGVGVGVGGQLDKQQLNNKQGGGGGGGGGGGEPNHHQDNVVRSKAIVLYNKAILSPNHPTLYELAAAAAAAEEESHDDDDDHQYPDLTHSLEESSVDQSTGEEELDVEDGSSSINDDQTPVVSVIDLVRNSKEEEGENFRLEDEIDHVADLFIRRFHQQMRMQKQASFKRYQEMLQRSV